MGPCQLSGTGGCSQFAGSEYSPEWAGITSIPDGVITSIKACTTATEAPQTHPRELREE
jgi:hypothetical protein